MSETKPTRPSWEELQTAIGARDYAEVSALLKRGADQYQHKVIVQSGGHVNMCSGLSLASEMGDVEMVKLLCEDRVYPYQTFLMCHQDKSGEFLVNDGMLWEAISHGRVEILKIFATHGEKLSPQLTSAIKRDTEDGGICTETLLAAGANPAYCDKHTSTPITKAVYEENATLLSLLLTAKQKIHKDELTLESEESQLLETLLFIQPFTQARQDCAEALLRHGAKLDEKGEINPTGWSTVIQPNNIRLFEGDYNKALTFLLTGGWMHPDTPKILGTGLADEMLLHAAVLYTDTEMIKTLLACGADVNALDSNGETPLASFVNPTFSDPVIDSENNRECISLNALLNAGADMQAPQGYQALSVLESWDSSKATLEYSCWKQTHRAQLREYIEAGNLAEAFVQNSKPTPLLLRSCAMGFLPELGSRSFWRDDPAQGLQVWNALSAVLPPYWQTRAQEVDTVPLEHDATPMGSRVKFERENLSKTITPVTRR